MPLTATAVSAVRLYGGPLHNKVVAKPGNSYELIFWDDETMVQHRYTSLNTREYTYKDCRDIYLNQFPWGSTLR